MIRINRGEEPYGLENDRNAELTALRNIAPNITSKQVPDTYRKYGAALCEAQYFKCCYCEIGIQKSNNDVEHFRPKASACRAPGCADSHGYWWLAYTWENLLYSCANCNRVAKNDKFPLATGSMALQPENSPPSDEKPLLIDPGGAVNPVEHIIFSEFSLFAGGPKNWYATPRNGSIRGLYTIEVCGLNRQDLLEVRNLYFKNYILPQIQAIKYEIDNGRVDDVVRQYRRALAMLEPSNQFVGLSYDAFCASISSFDLNNMVGKGWPTPGEVCNF